MKEKQTNSGMIELCQLGLRSHLQMVHWNAFRYLNPYLDWLFCTEVFTQRLQNPPFVKGTIWQTWLSFPVSQHSSLLSLFTAISSIRFHLLRFHTEVLYVEWAPHLILIFDLSSPHPPPPPPPPQLSIFIPLPLHPSLCFFLPSRPVYTRVAPLSPRHVPRQQTAARVTLAPRRSCLSRREADLTQRLCSIHQPARTAGVANGRHPLCFHSHQHLSGGCYPASAERNNSRE